MSTAPFLPLSDGTDIPQFYSSCFCCDTVDKTVDQVKAMFGVGIRHFQIAELFGNGHIIIKTLREVCEKREDLYITLKVWPKERGPEELIQAVMKELETMSLEYVDLLLVHSPIDLENKADQYKALEELKDRNITRSIAVSNISAVLLQDLLKNCRITPVAFELEVTPFNQNDDMVEFLSDSSICALNQEPVGKGLRHKNDPKLQAIADDCSLSITRLLIAYSYTKKLAIGLPASHTNMYIGSELTENITINDLAVELPSAIMDKLLSMEAGKLTTFVPVERVEDDDKDS
jgi:diketogulonate reductase-like aldo/keto reductase